MDLGLDRALRAIQGDGELRVGEAVDMAQYDGAPVRGREGHQQGRPFAGDVPCLDRRGRSARVGGARLPVARQWHIEGDGDPPGVAAASQARTAEVEHDRGQPGSQAQFADTGRVVPGERTIRAHECILGGLLRVARIPEHPQGDRVATVLMRTDKGLERTVEIVGERGDEWAVGIHHPPEPGTRMNRCTDSEQYRSVTLRRRPACDNRPTMTLDDRFDDLIASLAGFHRSWLVALGLDLGFFGHLRAAGANGLTVDDLADLAGCRPNAVEAWAWAADAHDLAIREDDRLTIEDDIASILLDDGRPEFLGGQFVHAAVASLDWGGMLEFFRTGAPIQGRPDRYRVAIERLTAQDIAVFFQEALAELPQLVADLSRGGRVVDVHCGGGRWLVAMARRFPALDLVGVEFETDSVLRAQATVAAAGLTDRIAIRQTRVTEPGQDGEFDLAYFQYALHQLPDAPAVLRAAWSALRPGGRLLVLDWPLPSDRDEFRTRHGELIAGVQLDELYQGTALATREQFVAWFAAAELPTPVLIDLRSGASLFVVERT